MKRIHRIVALALVIVLVLTVPAFAAPTSSDGIISGLLSGWSGTSSPTYYSSSWFWRVVSELSSISKSQSALNSGWSSSYPSGYSSSWYYRVVSLLLDIKSNTASSSSGSSSSNFTTVNSSNLNLIYSYLSNSNSGWTTMMLRLLNLYTNSGLILDELEAIDGRLVDGFGRDVATDLSLIKTCVDSVPRIADDSHLLLDYVGPEHYEHYSWFAEMLDETGNLTASFDNLLYTVRDIRDVIADEQDKAINDSFKDEKDSFNNGFGSVDRTTSIGDFSGFEGGFKSWFSLPGVDITSLFDQVDTGFSGWFSQETADSLKAQYGIVALDLDEDESETPLLDENQRQVQEILSGGDGEW